MDPQNIIRAGIAASVALHLSFVTLALLFSEVRPFDPVAAEARDVAVDVVTPDQVPENPPEPAPAPTLKPQPDLDLSTKPALDNSPPASAASQPSQPPAPPSSPAQSSATPPAASQASPQPQPQAAPAPDKPQPNAMPSAAAGPVQPPPAYVQPQPDISVKYHVLLGLPQDAPGDAFDAPATENADIEANSIAAFRRHLKDCATLPKSISPTDDVAIKLRVTLTRDGRLTTDPQLIEAKASMKGPLLMQAAIGALRSCQPYGMLPPDKYDQWKVLDISFTPRDFGAS